MGHKSAVNSQKVQRCKISVAVTRGQWFSLKLCQGSGKPKVSARQCNDEGSTPEILSGIAQTTAAMTKLEPVWNDRSISLSSKIWQMHSLVTSTFLHACESWTLTAELKRGTQLLQAMEMRCYCKILSISYKDYVTMLPTRKSVPKSSRQSDHTKTS